MASVPQFYSDYSFSNDFSQFQNPLLIPPQNCIDAAIPTSVTCGEEISFPMFFDNGGLDVFQQQQPNLTSSASTALLPDNNSIVASGTDGRYRLQDVLDEFGDECNAFVHQDFKPVEPAMTQISVSDYISLFSALQFAWFCTVP